MALTKVQTIGIETGISLTGVTSAVNLNVTGITTVGVVSATSLNASGVITATSFVGSGSQLTGVASTENIRTNTNATFLQNINVTGIVTAAGVNASGVITATSSIVGSAVTINASGINATGVITATSFSGSGANLTGLAATANVTTSSLVVIGVTTVAAGSTAAPSITPTGDSDTGIFFPSADTIAFGEGGSESARFDSSGRLLVGTSTATANGGVLQVSNGITFPATQSACSDVNTLDDYEEGFWTPGFSFGDGTTGITYSGTGASYMKIGDTVYANFDVAISSKGSSSGVARVTGLPFTSSGDTAKRCGGFFTYKSISAAIYIYLGNGNTAGVIFQGANTEITNVDFTNTTQLIGMIIYRV